MLQLYLRIGCDIFCHAFTYGSESHINLAAMLAGKNTFNTSTKFVMHGQVSV